MVLRRGLSVATLALVILPLAVAVADEPVLQLRFAQPDAGEGLERMETLMGSHPFWLSPEVELSEADVDSAFADTDVHGVRPGLELVLDAEGSRRFARLTRDNLGRHLGVVVDGELIMAPVIQGAITGGRLAVSGFADEGTRDRMLQALAGAGVAVGTRPGPPTPQEMGERMERALAGEIDSLRTVFTQREAEGFSAADTLLAEKLFDMAWLSDSQDRPELGDELNLLAARVWARALPEDPAMRIQVLESSIRTLVVAGELEEAGRLWAELRPLLAERPAALERSMPMPMLAIECGCRLGLAHARTGNLPRAVKTFESALELPYPDWLWTCRLGLIETVLAQGQVARARALCDEAMSAPGSEVFREPLRDLHERIEEAGTGG